MRCKILTAVVLVSASLTAKSLSSSTMPKSKNKNVRVELFFKDEEELRQRIRFLSSKGIKSFNLVNKNTRDKLQEWVEAVHDEIPDSSVCVHYSAKYNKSRQQDGALSLFQCFMQDMDQKEGDSEVLLITGSGDKGKFNSLSGLQRIQSPYSTPIAVAFNPFFPDSKDMEAEKDRLLGKLATQQVKTVYFQFGTDLQRLREALDWLETLKFEYGVEVCGSIFLPTKKLIAQQKFRPWNGVFLTEEFLESEEGARGIVLEMMRLYDSYDRKILIEAPGVRNEKDMALVESLLEERGSTSVSSQKQASDHEELRDGGSNLKQEAKKRRINRVSQAQSVHPAALQQPAIVLFGSFDVRIHDNEAFQLASFHSSIIPVFIWCKEDQGKWGVRGAAEVVLKDALRNLDATLSSNGLKLVCRATDKTEQELSRLCVETSTSIVYWNKEHTPESRIREDRNRKALELIGVGTIECQSSLLYDPTMLSLSGGFQGGHWGTLMPFLKACRKQLGEPRRPIHRHETFALLQQAQGPSSWPKVTAIDCLDIGAVKGNDRWDELILKRFPMSEDEALKSMNAFFSHGFFQYEKDRSRADKDRSTSKLSAHLRIGTLSPNELYHKIEDSDLEYDERKTFSRRLFWRDLAYFQLLNFPKMRDASIRTHYEQTEWISGEEERRRFEAWKWGKTGYPLVDAGMRELYATGWITQSVRMIVASFLTEYLRVNWAKGCEWFHYTLVDADSAINAMMWQNAGRKLKRFEF